MAWNGVTMDAYPDMSGIDGYGLVQQLAGMPNVVKALEATGTLPRSGPGIDALGVEDVSAVMASAEYLEEELLLWSKMKKVPAKSLIVEFARMNSFGKGFRDGFISGQSQGVVDDPQFARDSAIIRYLAEKYETDLPTQGVELIGPQGRGINAMATNRMAAMGRLLRNIELALVWSNSNVSPLMWKGLFQWIDDNATLQNKCRLDLRGGFMNRYVLAFMANVFAGNHANPTDVFIPNEGYLDLQLSLFPEIRRGDNIPNAAVGQDFDRFLILLLGGRPGYMQIERMAFLTNGIGGGMPLQVPLLTSAGGPNAPASVAGAAIAGYVADTTRPGLKAGTYYASVIGIGESGNSVSTQSAAVTVTDAGAIRWTVNCADESVKYYILFRNKAGESGVSESNRYFLARFNRPAGVATVTFDDNGYWMPDTYHALALTMNPLRTYIKQLFPVMNRPLPNGMMTNQSGLLYFGTPVMEEPMKNVHVANIGKQPQIPVGALGSFPI